LGSLGFVNLYTFEYPDENDFGEEELVDIGYLSTIPLSEEEQAQIASALKVMREKGEGRTERPENHRYGRQESASICLV